MAPLQSWARCRCGYGLLLLLLSFTSSIHPISAATPKYVETTTDDGQSLYLLDDRKPSLYTQNFGDCKGNSLINVTRFDAAYYKDNMTVLFHLEGNTAVANESLVRRLTVSIQFTMDARWLTIPSLHRCVCLWTISL